MLVQALCVFYKRTSDKFAKRMLRRITRNKQLIDTVATLVYYHMVPVQFVDSQAKLSAYRRLARKLSSHANIAMLAKLALADKRGRNPTSQIPLDGPVSEIDMFLKKAEEARVKYQKEPALLTGKDFLDMVKPGPLLGHIVKKAYELQMDGIRDTEELKKLTLQHFADDIKKGSS